MNRMWKFLRVRKRKIAVQPVRDAPTICSFCGYSISGSVLNASSKPHSKLANPDGSPLAMICSRCIDQLSVISKLSKWYQRFYRGEGFWEELRNVVAQRVSCERCDAGTQAAVTDVTVRLMKRACSIMHGNRANGFDLCPHTGVALASPRIAIVSSNPSGCVGAIVSAADIVGFPTLVATGLDTTLDNPLYELKTRHCNGDGTIVPIGLIVMDEHIEIAGEMAVVFALASTLGLPRNVEIVRVPD